jgi:outer membrane protein OmpA-like peptidoglycan-associated protein
LQAAVDQAERDKRAREQDAATADQRARTAEQRLSDQSLRLSAEERARLDAERKQAAAEAARSRAEAEAEADRAARIRAEQASADAMRRVAEQEAVSEEPRGRVITLSGSVLFASGTATLLPSARQRLDDVAAALASEHNAQFIVEGYTDSLGREEINRKLSEARAEAVRDYLVDRGIDATRVRAVGKGDDRPIASNATAEGRANNRRVEIVISRRQAQR